MTAVSTVGGVPLETVVTVTALVIGVALSASFVLTVGLSAYRARIDARERRVRSDLEDALLDRLFAPAPDWDGWVAGLSSRERSAVESLLDEYIRELDGADADRLRALGAALGVPERAGRRLERRGEYRHLRALTWLTLLERPDRYEAAAFTPGTPREREAVARLYHECGAGDPRDSIDTLLAGTTAPLTVFGQDTLHQLAREAPGALLAVADDGYADWSTPLLVQVLTVCAHLGAAVGGEDLSWVVSALEHDDERVRAAAARALGAAGWREDLRERAFVDRLVADPSPTARAGVYEMLAEWGDDRALDRLVEALAREDDEWARLAGARALVGRRRRLDDGVADDLGTAWAWSTEMAAYDRRARRGAGEVA